MSSVCSIFQTQDTHMELYSLQVTSELEIYKKIMEFIFFVDVTITNKWLLSGK